MFGIKAIYCRLPHVFYLIFQFMISKGIIPPKACKMPAIFIKNEAINEIPKCTRFTTSGRKLPLHSKQAMRNFPAV